MRAYAEQIEAVQALGGRLIVMASRALARVARGPDDYRVVYRRILAYATGRSSCIGSATCSTPRSRAIGAPRLSSTMEIVLEVIDGTPPGRWCQDSLLDAEKEDLMRRRLPAGVKMYTGDDFNYAELIKGDAQGHSHALLGIFDPIAAAASAALSALGAGDAAAFERLLEPTVP